MVGSIRGHWVNLSPNHRRWYAKWKLRCNIYTLHTRFCMFSADLYAQSALINKISASELSRKFIKSVLLVGVGVGVKGEWGGGWVRKSMFWDLASVLLPSRTVSWEGGY